MAVLNKNNYGYITPSDFNLFAKQAQLDIFEDYFYQYNYQLNKENKRLSGTGYADIKKGLEEVIDGLSEYKPLTNIDLASTTPTRGVYANSYYTPSLFTTDDNYYLLNKLLVYEKLRIEGTTEGIDAGGLDILDGSADFEASGVQVGDHVCTVLSNGTLKVATVLFVRSQYIVEVSEPIFTEVGQDYTIFDGSKIKEAERVTNSKITMLNNSLLTKPTLQYPSYTQEGAGGTSNTSSYDKLLFYPNNQINKQGQVMCQYIRYPRDPKWTYVTLANGDPVFDGDSQTYQDFELHIGDEVDLVNKILQYAGMSIREIAATNFGQGEETEDAQGFGITKQER